jgi:dihydropyrimidinase
MYGLYPRKGTIAVGSDADLVIWDDKREVTIANAMLHHAVDYTPYEGIKVTGWPALTLSRGEEVWNEQAFCGRAGHGRFLKCGLPAPARPRPRDFSWRSWTGLV